MPLVPKMRNYTSHKLPCCGASVPAVAVGGREGYVVDRTERSDTDGQRKREGCFSWIENYVGTTK